MGGFGSGNRHRFDSKNLADDYRSLDVMRLHQEGCLQPGIYSWYWKDSQDNIKASIDIRTWTTEELELSYMVNRSQDVRYSVSLTYTPCNYGGKRSWFICPGKGCGRRVAKLYIVGIYFLCRHCYDLAYQSQREDRLGRIIAKEQEIRRKLGGSISLISPFPKKPKWMHWRTYRQLLEEVLKLDKAYSEAMTEFCRRISPGAR